MLDTKLLSVAVPMSSVANSFVIKTLEGEQENYSTGPMFSAASEEECRKWIMSINETIVQQKIATRHQHPLPSNGAPTDHAPPTCAICEQAHPYLYCKYLPGPDVTKLKFYFQKIIPASTARTIKFAAIATVATHTCHAIRKSNPSHIRINFTNPDCCAVR